MEVLSKELSLPDAKTVRKPSLSHKRLSIDPVNQAFFIFSD
jgi:hypothetical protein